MLKLEILESRILLSLSHIPDWMNQQGVDHQVFNVPDGDMVSVDITLLEKGYTTPDELRWDVPYFKKPLIDFSGIYYGTDLVLGLEIFVPDGDHPVLQEMSLNWDATVLNHQIIDESWQLETGVDKTYTTSYGTFTACADVALNDDLTFDYFDFQFTGDFSASSPSYNLVNATIPIGPSIPLIANLAELNFSLDATADLTLNAGVEMGLDFDSLELKSAYANLYAGLNLDGDANAAIGNFGSWSVASAGIKATGRIEIGLETAYTPVSGWSIKAPLEASVGGTFYYDTVIKRFKGQGGSFEWKLVEDDMLANLLPTGSTTSPLTDYSAPVVTLVGLSSDPNKPSVVGETFPVTGSAQGIAPNGFVFVTWKEVDGSWVNETYHGFCNGSGILNLELGVYRVGVAAIDDTYSGYGYSDFGYATVIDTASVNFMLVMDASGSMSGSSLNGAKTAAKVFTDLTNSGDNIGVVSYDTTAILEHSLTEIDAAGLVKSSIKPCIDSIGPRGSTSIGAGLLLANSQLANVDGKDVIILMTDGQQNTSPWAMDVINNYVGADVSIYTIGFGSGADEGLLRQIAATRNGEYFFAANNFNLQKIYTQVCALASGSDSILNENAVILPSETDYYQMVVKSGMTQITVGLNWPGSNLDIVLIDPNGKRIDHSVALTDPNIELVEESTYEFYKIDYPDAGTWTVEVQAIDVNPAGEEYQLYSTQSSPIISGSEIEVYLPDGTEISKSGSLDLGRTGLVLSVRNPGRSPLNITHIDIPAGFKLLKTGPLVIPAGESSQIQIGLNPQVAGKKEGQIVIHSNGTSFEFGITGYVVSNSEIAVYLSNDVPVLDNSSSVVVIRDSNSPDEVFEIRNQGNSKLTISEVIIPEGFKLLETGPFEISSGGSSYIKLGLDENVIGNRYGQIIIVSNDESFKINVAGYVAPKLPKIELSLSDQKLENGDDVSFGDTAFGQTSSLTFEVSNVGNAPLVISEIFGLENHVVIESLDSIIVPGSSDSFTVCLQPNKPLGNYSSTFKIGSNDLTSEILVCLNSSVYLDNVREYTYSDEGNPVQIKLSGPGTFDVFPDDDLRFIVQGSTTKSVFSISGEVPIDVGSISVEGSLSKINAPKVNVSNEISVSGNLGSLVIGDLLSTSQVSVGETPSRGLNINADVINGRLDIDGVLRNLAMNSCGPDGEIVADSVGKISSKGDFFGNISTTNSLGSLISSTGNINGQVKASSIGSIKVPDGSLGGQVLTDDIQTISAECVFGLQLVSTNGIKKVSVRGDIVDSWFLTGLDLGDTNSPQDDSYVNSSIGRFSFGGEFRNSQVCSSIIPNDLLGRVYGFVPDYLGSGESSIGPVSGKHIQFSNGGQDFGFYSTGQVKTNISSQGDFVIQSFLQ